MMTEGSDQADDATEEYGITAHDMEKIAAYLRKPGHRRDVDDLRDAADK